MGSEDAGWGACAILYRALRESLTEKMIFEQKPEVKERKSLKNADTHISDRETSTKALWRGTWEASGAERRQACLGPQGSRSSGKHGTRESGEARVSLLATLQFGILFLMKREITEMWEQKRRIT